MEFHEVANIFPMMTTEEFKNLVDDIRKNGLINPIVTYQNKIIDGRNRYLACRELGIEPETKEWNGKGDMVAYVVGLNLTRRHLNESQRAIVAARIKPMFEEAAKERMVAGKKPNPSANLQKGTDPIHAHEQAAKILNVSPRTVESASKVLKDGTPELVQAVESGQVKVSLAATLTKLPEEKQKEVLEGGRQDMRKAAQQIYDRESEQRKRAKRNEPQTPPKKTKPVNLELVDSGQFNIIYCDPQNGNGINNLHDILISEWIAENAVLFLWCDVDELPAGIKALTDWGFKYRSFISWDMGLYFKRDEWLKHQNRLLLIGERGSYKPAMPTTATQIFTDYARMENREEKPERFFEEIEAMFPKQRYFTVFNIASRKGWVMKKGGFEIG